MKKQYEAKSLNPALLIRGEKDAIDRYGKVITDAAALSGITKVAYSYIFYPNPK